MSESPAQRRRVRICYFNTWAGALEDAAGYLARVPEMNLAPRVTDAKDAALMRKARLDCDWYAENLRCFAAMRAEEAGVAGEREIEFLPAWVCGKEGVLDFAKAPREPSEERWLITMAHQPQAFGPLAEKVFALLAKTGVRHVFYAFDEASRAMACFPSIAPYLDVLIHDERPLAEAGRAKLRAGCHTIHRSWVANVVPFAETFNETPEERILFLGSQMGLTPHRRRQLDFLRERFRDKLVASHDHSVAVTARGALNRYKVGFCPEGRMFATPAMSRTHTDRPFWSGCLGMVPLSEDSQAGGRLEELAREDLIVRYAHGDLESLAAACERALAMPNEARRKIYEHFNRHETVGTVVAREIAAAGR